MYDDLYVHKHTLAKQTDSMKAKNVYRQKDLTSIISSFSESLTGIAASKS